MKSHIFKTKNLKLLLITSFIFTQSVAYTKPLFIRVKCQIDTLAGNLIIPSKHINSTIGIGSISFRDFATSPLFYNGPSIYYSIGETFVRPQMEWDYKINLNYSSTTAQTPYSPLITVDTYSMGLRLEAEISSLYQNPNLIFEKYRIQIGGVGIFTSNIRFNESFGNNGIAVDNLVNFMLSGRIVGDISRTKEKTVNLYLFPIKLKPLKRELLFQTDVGIININHRPGYAYSYESEIYGTETGSIKWWFDNYQWAINGWRLRTNLTYKSYYKNGNAHSISYLWEALSAPGKIEPFQMAVHSIRYTRYFSLK